MGLYQCYVIICVLALCCVLMIPTREQLMHSKTSAVLVRDFLQGNTTTHADNTSCSASWGVFRRNESVLTETQLMLPRKDPPPPFNLSAVEDGSFDGLFIDPANNFAFCAIPKNAITQWMTVLRNVYRNITTNGFTTPAYGIGKVSQEKHGVQTIKNIYESPNSTVAVMVRDPLTRFVSVYLNKCFDLNCTSSYCLPRVYKNLPTGTPISFQTALNWILDDNVDLAKIDRHWALQSEQCGMKNGGLDNYFTIVGKMTKQTLNHDAACIMERAGLARYNVAATNDNCTFWNSGGVKTKEYRSESEEDVLRKLFTPKAARQLMSKFQQDYNVFQLPVPDWIYQATGEWMDSLDHHNCAGRAW